jgi:exodeoxyribonuclease V gamma subunit
VTLAVAREAWLDAVDEPSLSQRFKAGGVTFCTLLPLRAIPFEVVCLLGMNDGDYPRRSTRSDFDLMGLPGQARPGDRSRRDDDRQLMLDALLSARRVLYVSWCGRSQRDNQEQPPSVLVAQLREYLERGFGERVVAERTSEHPLQPFSRRYFESSESRDGEMAAEASSLFTYAREWRAAHVAAPSLAAGMPIEAEPDNLVIGIDELARFLKNPVRAWFQRQLLVRFDEIGLAGEDDEVFSPIGLERWRWMEEMLRTVQALPWDERGEIDAASQAEAAIDAQLRTQVTRLARAGRLPLGAPGRQQEALLHETLEPMVRAWVALRAAHREEHKPLACRIEAAPDLLLEDRIGELRAGEDGALWRIALRPDRLLDGADADEQNPRKSWRDKRTLRADKVHGHWLASLAAAAGAGAAVRTVLIGSDALVHITPVSAATAQGTLQELLRAWRTAVYGARPWPTAMRTGLAHLQGQDSTSARDVYDSGARQRGESADPYLARLFPDFAALTADASAFETATRTLYAAYDEALKQGQVRFETLDANAEAPGIAASEASA